MKLLVTGGCGFIGSNFIINEIDNYNNSILNFDKLTYAGNLENLEKYNNHQLYQFFKGDINDKEKVFNILLKFKPDCIVNFAAESHVDRSINGPSNFVNTNILGTFALLEMALKYFKQLDSNEQDKFKVIQISTDEVYGSLGEEGKFSELSTYNPSSPYSASKASADFLAKAWYKTYDLPVIITNCSNNFGPYQFPEKLIPLMILSCLEKKNLPVYGDGKNIRDWLYVEDHCDAIHTIIEKGITGENYNIGANKEKSNIEIVNLICEIMNDKMKSDNNFDYKDLIQFVKDRPGHDFRYAIDSSKIYQDLGWEPKYEFKKAILKTVDWYLDHQNWWKKIVSEKYKLNRLG